jgi:uncharacterized protein (DUF433 family)
MEELPVNGFVEMRGGGYYLVGSRVSLDSIAYEVREGRTLTDIIEDYCALEGEERLVQGAIDYIRAHQAAVDAYLLREEQRYAELCRQNPLPPGLAERIRKYRIEKGLKSA